VASVTIPTTDDLTVVPGDVCVQTGVTTTERIVIQGNAAPRWVVVPVLWPYLFALFVRGYRIELPMTYDALDLWRRMHRIAWVGTLGGTAAVPVGALAGLPAPMCLLAVPVAFLGFGVWNGLAHRPGIRRTWRGRTKLLRVHPAAAAEIDRLLRS
jgi:hypothetical protein